MMCAVRTIPVRAPSSACSKIEQQSVGALSEHEKQARKHDNNASKQKYSNFKTDTICSVIENIVQSLRCSQCETQFENEDAVVPKVNAEGHTFCPHCVVTTKDQSKRPLSNSTTRHCTNFALKRVVESVAACTAIEDAIFAANAASIGKRKRTDQSQSNQDIKRKCRKLEANRHRAHFSTMKEELVCDVCIHKLTSCGKHEPKILPCGHTFCSNCCDEMHQRSHKSCPTCKAGSSFSASDLRCNRELASLVRRAEELESLEKHFNMPDVLADAAALVTAAQERVKVPFDLSDTVPAESHIASRAGLVSRKLGEAVKEAEGTAAALLRELEDAWRQLQAESLAEVVLQAAQWTGGDDRAVHTLVEKMEAVRGQAAHLAQRLHTQAVRPCPVARVSVAGACAGKSVAGLLLGRREVGGAASSIRKRVLAPLAALSTELCNLLGPLPAEASAVTVASQIQV